MTTPIADGPFADRPAADRPIADGPVADEGWRGVAEEKDDTDVATGLRMARRSRALLGSLLRPHRGAALIAAVLLLGDSLAQLAGPLLVAYAIDSGVPAAMAGSPAPLAWAIAGYAVCGLGSAALRAGFLMASGRIGQAVLLDLRGRVFRHGQRLSLDFHESYTSGRFISRLTSDVDALNDLLEHGLDGLLGSMLSLVGISALLVWLDAPLAAVVFAGFVPLLWLARRFQRQSRSAYRLTRSTVAAVIVHFVESMNGIRAVQAFRREARNETIMTTLNHANRDAHAEAALGVARFVATIRLVGGVTLAVVLLVGGWRVAHGGLELGVFTAVLLYLSRLYDPLDELAQFLNSYSSAAAALDKISGVLAEEPTVAEPARPRVLPTPLRGELELDGVSFSYSRAADRVVLPRMSLRVPAGQTVALVGATGAGKSTLAKLVARLYDPVDGAVRLDGADLRDLADSDLRRAVVMVTQESFLFSGSVADNIALGRPSASRAEVVAAGRAVGADGFVDALPQGYDTDVRKRGGRLSAGQRQLVSLARVLLADPAVLVLDEATASLDIPSERAVQAALDTVLADRTAVIIAHRLSTVLVADRVLVMADGRITEDGSPAELVAVGGGEFAGLHAAWLDSLA